MKDKEIKELENKLQFLKLLVYYSACRIMKKMTCGKPKPEHRKGGIIRPNEKDEKLINVVDTEWYKKQSKKMTPGKTLRVYRECKGYNL